MDSYNSSYILYEDTFFIDIEKGELELEKQIKKEKKIKEEEIIKDLRKKLLSGKLQPCTYTFLCLYLK